MKSSFILPLREVWGPCYRPEEGRKRKRKQSLSPSVIYIIIGTVKSLPFRSLSAYWRVFIHISWLAMIARSSWPPCLQPRTPKSGWIEISLGLGGRILPNTKTQTEWTFPSTQPSWDSNINKCKDALDTSCQTSLGRIKVLARKPTNFAKPSQNTHGPDNELSAEFWKRSVRCITRLAHKPRCP